MFASSKLPPSASVFQKLLLPLLGNFFYFFFIYLPYAPVRRVNKPELHGPYIWASSHSNFLCDAIPAVYEGPAPVRFLVKSTLFRFPLRRFLAFCGALPLARTSDQKELSSGAKAAQNRATFKAAIAAIKDGWSLAIYPEGVSVLAPGLVLPLKGGVAKLALAAEESAGFGLGLRIIPVGLEYGSRIKVGSGLCIRYGKPILVASYRAAFERDPGEAARMLMRELTAEMMGSFPHFTEESRLSLGKKLVAMGLFPSKFDAAKFFQQREADQVFWLGLEQRLRSFDEATKRAGIPISAWGHRAAWRSIKRHPLRLVWLMLGLPLSLVDFLNNSLPEFFLGSITELLAADETENMTVRFALSGPILGAVYAVQFWLLRYVFLAGTLNGWGLGAYMSYATGSFFIWYMGVHWRRQFRQWISLLFFRRVKSKDKRATLEKYQKLREHLGQLQYDGRKRCKSGADDIKC